jgi:hypothetical protein
MQTLRHAGKPMTFAEIFALAYPEGSFEADMIKALGPSKVSGVRSLRRAVHKMVEDQVLIALGNGGPSEPYRYFFHPMLIGMMGDSALQKALEADSGAELAVMKLLWKHKSSTPRRTVSARNGDRE